jgi:hypothetical protein
MEDGARIVYKFLGLELRQTLRLAWSVLSTGSLVRLFSNVPTHRIQIKEMSETDQVNVLIVRVIKIKNISARGAELFNNSTRNKNISTNGVGVELVKFNS